MKHLLFLIAFSVLLLNASAQVVYFPSCKDLEITNMKFDEKPGSDTLFITVYNDCDTCDQMVYTGLLVVSEGDTLAMSRTRGNEQSPENNTSRTYAILTKKGKFDLTASSLKVEMYDVCDSIPVSLDYIMGVTPDLKNNNEDQVILSGSQISTVNHNLLIRDITIYSMSGTLVQRNTGLSVSSYDLNLRKPGTYLISLVLSNDAQVSRKYIKVE